MRDEMDARIWNDHHDQFSEWLDEAFIAAGERVKRYASQVSEAPRQALLMVAALGLTLLTFTATVA